MDWCVDSYVDVFVHTCMSGSMNEFHKQTDTIKTCCLYISKLVQVGLCSSIRYNGCKVALYQMSCRKEIKKCTKMYLKLQTSR